MNCYQKAAQLLASRPHFRAELAIKLAKRGFAAEEAVAALDRLEQQGYLDDTKTAADFIAHRRERGGEGRLRLRAELVRRGARPEAIDAALAGLNEEDDMEAARAAYAVAARSKKDPAAIARHLARKGFSRRAILAVLHEGPEGSADLALDDLETEDAGDTADTAFTDFDQGFEPE
ncbi:MAG TPA: RecX family transcriptional regulator [Thermoanaerobaculia bacterium]